MNIINYFIAYGSLKLALELREMMLNNKNESERCRKGDVKHEQ